MTIILGLTTSHHDGAVALFVDKKLVGAISKERVTRIKKEGYGNDEKLIKQFLKQFNLSVKDIDFVAFSDDPQYAPVQEDNYIKFYKNGILSAPLSADELVEPHLEFVAEIEGRKVPAFQVHHQLSHCAYSFYTSNLNSAVCLSMDASGPVDHTSSIIAIGKEKKIELVKSPAIHVGNMYNAFTGYLGLGPGLYKAGSLMGLASYGTPLKIALEEWETFDKYEASTRPFIEEENKGFDFEIYWRKLSGGLGANAYQEFFKNDSKQAMDIAASTQYIFEKIILKEVNKIYDDYKDFHEENICLSGGSFLNCNVNTLIKKETLFKKVSISPACGDDGLSAGAALYVAHNLLGIPRYEYKRKEIMYLGGSYSVPEIGKPYDAKEVAKLISEGKVVAWFQGRSEFGPRALGNRSLLADPRNPEMRDHLNFNVKHREWFRPYAPSVLAEKSKDWFEFDEESPYMLHTMNVKKPKEVPAITHVDGTARIQTVTKEDNPRYYEIISEFEKITGVPMVLNTSLNGNGEPILETPEDAFNFLKNNMNCDLLVIEDRVVYRADLN